MEFKEVFPNTYKSFNPFRADFEYDTRGYKNIKSCDGRLFSLKKLAFSPVSIPLKIAKKVFSLVAVIFLSLAELVHIQDDYFTKMKACAIEIIDRLCSLIFTPLNILVARIRYLLGLIHPCVVFTG